MTTDDHDGDDPLQDRGDSDKPTRDPRGRWRPGYCPNSKGRPKKNLLPDQSDIRIFGNTMIDFVVSGQKEMMDRRTALNNKMFESAMKGKVSMQRFLYKEFVRNDERLAAVRLQHECMVLRWIINNPDYRKPDYDIPLEAEIEIRQLQGLMDHYFPSSYPPDGVSANDCNDDADG